MQPGDTLCAIAARAGTTAAALAALNGLSPDGVLLIGTRLSLPGTAGQSGEAAGPGATAPVTPAGSSGPYPTAETVSSAQVGAEASADGVDPGFAEAIGWQESGDNNALVSPTGAVGVMQIEPATWSWINSALTPGAPLDPGSAVDNVRGGVLLLRDLVAETGSDALAAAAYYQGLQSVREHGVSPNTQQYVNAVLALQSRFGG